MQRLRKDVTAEYSNKIDSGSGSGSVNPDPLLRPADITWGFNTYTKVVDIDTSGDPVTNSAGDLFDPPPEDEIYRLKVSISQNEASFNPATAWQLIDTTNNAPITIAGAPVVANQALLQHMGATAQYENGVSYAKVNYEIELSPDFTLYLLDIGFYEIATANTKTKNKDDAMREVTEPFLLNGSGVKLATGGTPQFLPFTIKESVSWAGL